MGFWEQFTDSEKRNNNLKRAATTGAAALILHKDQPKDAKLLFMVCVWMGIGYLAAAARDAYGNEIAPPPAPPAAFVAGVIPNHNPPPPQGMARG